MPSIVPQATTPDNGKAYTNAVAEAGSALRRAVSARVAAGAGFGDHEAALLAAANEACRLELEATLQATAEAQPARLRIDGALYERHQEGAADYHSLCGALHVRRATYRQTGERNGPTVVPLELATGLIEVRPRRWRTGSPSATRRGPAAARRDRSTRTTGCPRRAARWNAWGRRWARGSNGPRPALSRSCDARRQCPGAHAVSVGLDRTTVPMEEARRTGAPPTTRRRRRTTAYVRTPPALVDVKYRMAYVGTVSLVDQAGEALVTRRYAISGAEDPADLTAQMIADIRRAREQHPRIPVGVVQDAAPELWTLMRGALQADAKLRRWHEGVDRYHLNERLAEVLRIAEPDEPRRRQRLRRWNDELDADDGAIDRIARWVATQIPWHAGEALATLEAHWTYPLNHNDRMRYATLRRVGLPCGSGATEGACKSVVMVRAKGCGQRWHEDGVNAALTLRAVYMSERLPTLWPHFAADYSADVQVAA